MSDSPPSGATVDCPHAERCGGCPLIHLPYAEQLDAKRRRVSAAFARYSGPPRGEMPPLVPADPIVAYRTRAKLMVGTGGRVGLYAKGGGHDVVDVAGCRVLAPRLVRVAGLLRARIAAAEAAGGGPLAPFESPGGGWLRAIDLREVAGPDVAGVLVTLVVDRARAGDLALLKAEAAAMVRDDPEVLGVAANLHRGQNPQVLGDETVVLAGVASAFDRIGAAAHLATFGSFVQAHRGQALKLHDMLVEALGVRNGQVRVLDLYGGSGATALALAGAGANVYLVEAFGPAVEQANAAARAARLPVEAHRADAATALRMLGDRLQTFDAIVVNPPRRGMSPAAREQLGRAGASIVAYVSCDPQTLARDVDHLGRLGFGLTSLRPLDMIPLTDEVETVALLRRASVPSPRVLHDGEEIVVVEKAPHEPTTPQGEYASSLMTRVRQMPGFEACVPLQRLEVGASGAVVLARRAEVVAKWSRVLASRETRTTYVAMVRGVTSAKGAVAGELRSGGDETRARTRYRRLAMASGQSLVRVVPDEGSGPLVRRHLATIGHPVVGDDRYGHAPTNRHHEERYGLDRLFLHCSRVAFTDPDSNERCAIDAPLPADLCGVLERMGAPASVMG